MQIVEPEVQIVSPKPEHSILNKLQLAGRCCYQSEPKSTTAAEFVQKLIKNGHLSVLEHESITFKIITDRAIANELVRHRIASYSQESTRYCNYMKKAMKFIDTGRFKNKTSRVLWYIILYFIEKFYNRMIMSGERPEIARSILPLCLKTEIYATMNIRQWAHVIKQRRSQKAHPDIRNIMEHVQILLCCHYPNIFPHLLKNES